MTIAAAPPIEVVVAPPPPPPPPPPAPPRPAPPRRRSRALVAVHAGYLTNFARVAAPTVGAEVASLVPVRHLHAGLAISYYASTGSATTADGEAITISVRAVPVLARLVVDVGPVFVGATAGAILGRTSLSSMSTGRSDERLIRPAVGVVAGGALGLGRGQLAIEVGYLHATAVGAASGAVAGYSLTGGYRLAL